MMTKWIIACVVGLCVCLITVFFFLRISLRANKKYQTLRRTAEKREEQLKQFIDREMLVTKFNSLRDRMNNLRPLMRKFERKYRRRIKKSDDYKSCEDKINNLFYGDKKKHRKIRWRRNKVYDSYEVEENPREVLNFLDDLISHAQDFSLRTTLLIFVIYPIAIITITGIANVNNILYFALLPIFVMIIYLVRSYLMEWEIDLLNVVIAFLIGIGIALLEIVVIFFFNLDYAWYLVSTNMIWGLWIEGCFFVYMICRVYYRKVGTSYANCKIEEIKKNIAKGNTPEEIEKTKRRIRDNEVLRENLIETINDNFDEIEKEVGYYYKGKMKRNVERSKKKIIEIYWDYRFFEELLKENISYREKNQVDMDAIQRMTRLIQEFSNMSE